MAIKTADKSTGEVVLDQGKAPSPAVAARVTVNLSRRTVDALNATTALTEDNRTEVINKAVQLYREVQEAQHNGGSVWLQSDQKSDPVMIRFY